MPNVKIWQLDRELGADRVFISYENLKDNFGPDPVQSLYVKVYDGELDTGDPEEVYMMFQRQSPGGPLPEGFAGWSLSISDIVQIGGGPLLYCDTFGFKPVRWKEAAP